MTRGHQADLCVVDLRRERASARARIHVSGALSAANRAEQLILFLHTAAGASARTRVLLICDTLMHINHSAATNSITSSQTCALHHPP